LALVSQSGAIVAGMAEWAAQRAIGFSAVVSIGDQLDVDFGDLLDFLALDRSTRAVLLYVESIRNARKFMSAARAAARAKPVVVVKSGRHAQGAKAAATHTGALVGDADAERYAAALEALIEDRENDAILVLNVPTALASPVDTAARVSNLVKSYRAKSVRPKPVFAVWIGANRAALDAFEAAEIPH